MYTHFFFQKLVMSGDIQIIVNGKSCLLRVNVVEAMMKVEETMVTIQGKRSVMP